MEETTTVFGSPKKTSSSAARETYWERGNPVSRPSRSEHYPRFQILETASTKLSIT